MGAGHGDGSRVPFGSRKNQKHRGAWDVDAPLFVLEIKGRHRVSPMSPLCFNFSHKSLYHLARKAHLPVVLFLTQTKHEEYSLV